MEIVHLAAPCAPTVLIVAVKVCPVARCACSENDRSCRQSHVFAKDGSLTVVNVYDDLKVEKDSVTFAGQTYNWRTEDKGIVLSS